ncbi:hypothetical protein JW921_05955 [Candidatus Fermentibacterales bacterium]|nr:hypothetical protein [Candidatus Fermentibacterales bacterium]
MDFVVRMRVENASFWDDAAYNESGSEVRSGWEVARLLREAADAVEQRLFETDAEALDCSVVLHDINGNRVGTAGYEN